MQWQNQFRIIHIPHKYIQFHNSHLSTELAEYTYIDEFIVALATFVSNTGQMWVSLLAVFSNHFAVVELILSEEPLGIVVGIDVDFGQGIMGGWFIDTLMDTRLQPGQQ